MGTPATLDDVMEAVCNSRAEGDEALAATALLLGAMMVRASVHIRVLDKRLDTTGERIARVESERDVALSARDAAQSALAVAKLAADKDREFLRLARDDAEMFAGQRDAAIARAEQAVQECDAASARAAALEADCAAATQVLSMMRARVWTAMGGDAAWEPSAEELVTRANDLRAERDAALACVTYEARTTPPTLAQREAHQAAGGAWLVVRIDSNGKIHADVLSGWSGWQWERVIFVALGADRLPCAWPVVSPPREVP